jgi:hypothetical protein
MATMKLDVPAALAARVATHFGEVSPATLAAAVEYAVNRKDALAKHSGKVRRVKAAKEKGKAPPKGLTFRRYVPAFTDAKLDAEGTDKARAAWAHRAPERA